MKTSIYFVRHAHSVYTPDELGRPLSAEGFRDAERVSELLEKERIDTVISSPYKRAVQTVQGTASVHGREIVLEEDFKERLLAGEPIKDFSQAILKVWEDPSFSWPGGESNVSAQQRGVDALYRTLNAYEGKNIVVGTHGNLMVLMMNHFDKKYGYDFWKELDMPDVYKLIFEEQDLIGVSRLWGRKKKGVI